MKATVRQLIEKLAEGYTVEEVTEEYGIEDGELKLVKRREVKKEVPSDLKAIKLLEETENYSLMTDEELEQEKKRLLEKLREES